jgi:ribosomal protein S12 methylthiotransferase
MTGFPGETVGAFMALSEFVDRCRFERLGVFPFSAEASSPAFKFTDQVPAHIAGRRKDTLMARQQEIARAYHSSLIGTTLEVLVEGVAPGGKLTGRAWNQAPEVDGLTVLRGQAQIGQIVQARVIAANPYDLEVEIVE